MAKPKYQVQISDRGREQPIPSIHNSTSRPKSTSKTTLGLDFLSRRSSKLPDMGLESLSITLSSPPGGQQYDANDGQYITNMEEWDESSEPSSENSDPNDTKYEISFTFVNASDGWERKTLRDRQCCFLNSIIDLDSESDSGLDQRCQKRKRSRVKET